MKPLYIFLMTIFLIQTAFPQPGTTGLSFLKTGISPRAIAMGDVYPIEKSDPAAVYYNPALLSLSNQTQVVFVHREWLKDTRTEFLGFSTMLDNFRFAFGVNSTSINDIEQRTIPGDPEGTFTSRNAALSFTTAYRINKLNFGISGKYLYEKILIDEASGYAFDLGLLYKDLYGFNLGFSVSNLGSMNELRYESSTLPVISRFGVSRIIDFENFDALIIPAADFVTITNEKKSHIHLGVEMTYKNKFTIRTGMRTGYEASFFAAGVGARYSILAFDYAFAPFKYELGPIHSFSILINL